MSPRVLIRQRARRLRASESIRELVQETRLHASDLILPVFVTEGSNTKSAITSLPGHYRLSPDLLLPYCCEAYELGIRAIALFPNIDENKKDSLAKEAMNPSGLIPQTIRLLKKEVPELILISDVAMDPYSSDGHDGILEDGKILNDETLRILAAQAVTHAEAGVDFVAPSDMMDGRIAYIREALDQKNQSHVGIISYAAKYASAFYGPFRDALNSAPKSGDKKTYQMNPANGREAIREVQTDLNEGADMVMVKPALAYLDVIQRVKMTSLVPVCAYNVSGEYAMLKASAEKGLGNYNQMMWEVLISIKRAGADLIFTYHALEMAKLLK